MSILCLLYYNHRMVSKSDNILRTRPIGETYEIYNKKHNHKLQFVKRSEDQYDDLNKPKAYISAGEILRQHKLEHSGTVRGSSNHPSFIIITSGPNRGKKLSEL